MLSVGKQAKDSVCIAGQLNGFNFHSSASLMFVLYVCICMYIYEYAMFWSGKHEIVLLW